MSEFVTILVNTCKFFQLRVLSFTSSFKPSAWRHSCVDTIDPFSYCNHHHHHHHQSFSSSPPTSIIIIITSAIFVVVILVAIHWHFYLFLFFVVVVIFSLEIDEEISRCHKTFRGIVLFWRNIKLLHASFHPSIIHSFLPSFHPSFIPFFHPSFISSIYPSIIHSFLPSFIHFFLPSTLHSHLPLIDLVVSINFLFSRHFNSLPSIVCSPVLPFLSASSCFCSCWPRMFVVSRHSFMKRRRTRVTR